MTDRYPSATPIVTIIVVSYNTAEMTVAALQSVYDTAADVAFELLVYDNDSSDGSAQAIAQAFPASEYPNLTLVVLDENVGFAAANNLGARRARGAYILLLNPDTVVLRGAIQALLTFAKRRPEARIWGGRTLNGKGRLDPRSCWGEMTLWSSFCFAFGLSKAFSGSSLFNPESYGGWDRTTERPVDIVSGCFFLVEAHLWRDLDGFDERFFMYAEEADFCLRARGLGARPHFTPEAEIIHFIGGSEAVRARRLMKMMSGKITIAKKHWNAGAVWLLRCLYRIAVLIRWAGYGGISKVSGKRHHREAAAEWKTVWYERGDWIGGY